jgi:hypothetical protein
MAAEKFVNKKFTHFDSFRFSVFRFSGIPAFASILPRRPLPVCACRFPVPGISGNPWT